MCHFLQKNRKSEFINMCLTYDVDRILVQDFVKLAEAMGAKAYKVSSREELRPALEAAFALGAPVVIDCQINCDDKVYPMVSPGAPIQDAFDDTDLKIK